MPFNSGGGTIGITENPVLDSRFVASWNDDTNLPPPGSNLIIAEDGRYCIDETGAMNMITE